MLLHNSIGGYIDLFHQQQIYSNYNENKVCKYCDGWDNAKNDKKLCFHYSPF